MLIGGGFKKRFSGGNTTKYFQKQFLCNPKFFMKTVYVFASFARTSTKVKLDISVDDFYRLRDRNFEKSLIMDTSIHAGKEAKMSKDKNF